MSLQGYLNSNVLATISESTTTAPAAPAYEIAAADTAAASTTADAATADAATADAATADAPASKGTANQAAWLIVVERWQRYGGKEITYLREIVEAALAFQHSLSTGLF